MFGSTGNIEEELKKGISESLTTRKAEACSTWDPEAVIALAWGVKEEIDMDHFDEVKSYMESVKELNVPFEGLEVKVNILKAGVREKNGKGTLIYRYQLDK